MARLLLVCTSSVRPPLPDCCQACSAHNRPLLANTHIWRSVDFGASFMHYRTTSVVEEGLWDMRGDDAFFEQTGTPFLTSSGDLIHAPRVGVRADWDET